MKMDTATAINSMSETLDCIDKRLQHLSRQMEDMETRCLAIENSTDRMDAHIDFVTRTYMYLRSPLMTLKGITNKLGSLFLSSETAAAPRARSILNKKNKSFDQLLDDDDDQLLDDDTDNFETHQTDDGNKNNELPLPPADQYPHYQYNYMKKASI